MRCAAANASELKGRRGEGGAETGERGRGKGEDLTDPGRSSSHPGACSRSQQENTLSF